MNAKSPQALEPSIAMVIDPHGLRLAEVERLDYLGGLIASHLYKREP